MTTVNEHYGRGIAIDLTSDYYVPRKIRNVLIKTATFFSDIVIANESSVFEYGGPLHVITNNTDGEIKIKNQTGIELWTIPSASSTHVLFVAGNYHFADFVSGDTVELTRITNAIYFDITTDQEDFNVHQYLLANEPLYNTAQPFEIFIDIASNVTIGSSNADTYCFSTIGVRYNSEITVNNFGNVLGRAGGSSRDEVLTKSQSKGGDCVYLSVPTTWNNIGNGCVKSGGGSGAAGPNRCGGQGYGIGYGTKGEKSVMTSSYLFDISDLNNTTYEITGNDNPYTGVYDGSFYTDEDSFIKGYPQGSEEATGNGYVALYNKTQDGYNYKRLYSNRPNDGTYFRFGDVIARSPSYLAVTQQYDDFTQGVIERYEIDSDLNTTLISTSFVDTRNGNHNIALSDEYFCALEANDFVEYLRVSDLINGGGADIYADPFLSHSLNGKLSISGDFLALSNPDDKRVILYDISDINNILTYYITGTDDNFGKTHALSTNRLAICSDSDTYVYDISNPASPIQYNISPSSTPTGYGSNMHIDGSNLVVTIGDDYNEDGYLRGLDGDESCSGMPTISKFFTKRPSEDEYQFGGMWGCCGESTPEYQGLALADYNTVDRSLLGGAAGRSFVNSNYLLNTPLNVTGVSVGTNVVNGFSRAFADFYFNSEYANKLSLGQAMRNSGINPRTPSDVNIIIGPNTSIGNYWQDDGYDNEELEGNKLPDGRASACTILVEAGFSNLTNIRLTNYGKIYGCGGNSSDVSITSKHGGSCIHAFSKLSIDNQGELLSGGGASGGKVGYVNVLANVEIGTSDSEFYQIENYPLYRIKTSFDLANNDDFGEIINHTAGGAGLWHGVNSTNASGDEGPLTYESFLAGLFLYSTTTAYKNLIPKSPNITTGGVSPANISTRVNYGVSESGGFIYPNSGGEYVNIDSFDNGYSYFSSTSKGYSQLDQKREPLRTIGGSLGLGGQEAGTKTLIYDTLDIGYISSRSSSPTVITDVRDTDTNISAGNAGFVVYGNSNVTWINKGIRQGIYDTD